MTPRKGLNLWWLFAAVGVVALSLVALNLGPVLVLDGRAGLEALIDPPPRDDNLEFTPGYTRWRFLRVRRGMTRDEVVRQMGEPWFRQVNDMEGIERWCYSRGKNVAIREPCRAVIFDSDKVIRLE